ncbi:MAG: homocysteine S-methyltransferase family protein [Lachnospiraceae bacterium]|nr:homocysteine S-methyltransferase family protein [Lachnospiraceae bacterium]
MKKQEFKELCSKKFIYLDGATGSNLVKAGMPSGVCPEKWIIDNPEAIINLQRQYVDAGSNIVYAPTFTSNRIKLSEYGLEKDIVYINKKLVELSKEAVGKKAYVAGDITMTGISLKPVGSMEFEDLIDIYKEQISILDEAGVDLLVVETMMSLQETRAALIAAKEVCTLPVMCTLTFNEDGRTLFGSDPKSVMITLESLGASAVGVNCSTGPDKMVDVIKKMAEVSDIPIIAKPNAGMPRLDDTGKAIYDMEASVFATECKALVLAGASILGGCCGTDPTYIKKLIEETKDMELPKHNKIKGRRYLSSERKSLEFDLGDPFIIVGERINPTGKKKLQAELKENKLDLIIQYTEEQERMGASILDINVGMGGIDEKSMMLKVLDEVGMLTQLPLSIDTSPCDVLEAALRKYPGRALVNSVSCESSVMEDKLKIAKKYGAMIIVLPLSDTGLPKNFEEKIDNLNTILKRAYELGYTKEDIVVDGLVSTVGANPNAANEVLETVKYAKENELATTCGLSNISFGLPERIFVNTAFLTMLINNGLTMAIMNPSQDLLVNAAFSADLLLNKKGADIRYINRMNENHFEFSSNTPASPTGKSETENMLDAKRDDILYQDVMKGNKDAIKEHTKKLLDEGNNPEKLLNDSLMTAIDEVGKLFNSGKYFLPQLISSAEAMKAAIEIIEPKLPKDSSGDKMPTVIMATVKGDIHDIGKNLVVLMLKNHGFNVIDLGKDVDKETIAKAAIVNNASIVGLSALMTTTMKEMANTVEYLHEKKVPVKIIVGGAVITEEYAKEIGADAYSKDAADAVIVAKNLV